MKCAITNNLSHLAHVPNKTNVSIPDPGTNTGDKGWFPSLGHVFFACLKRNETGPSYGKCPAHALGKHMSASFF